MNFQQLEYLKALAVFGNFSRAAEKLGVTQPALTLQIQKLEEEIGFKLVDRTKRPIGFTDEGTLFYQKAVELLKMADQLKDVTVELSEEVGGKLAVGIIPTLSPYLTPLFIGELNDEYPQLQVEITELKTEDIIFDLKMGNLDCGILSTPVSTNGVKFEPLFYEQFFIYMSENHRLFFRNRIAVDEINEEEIWYLEEGNCFQNQVNSICQINYQKTTEQNLIYRSSSIESLRRIVENKNGVTFIPELATINIPSEQEDLVKQFEGIPPVREISVVTPVNFAKERQVAALVQTVKNSVSKRMLGKPDGWIVDTGLRIK